MHTAEASRSRGVNAHATWHLQLTAAAITRETERRAPESTLWHPQQAATHAYVNELLNHAHAHPHPRRPLDARRARSISSPPVAAEAPQAPPYNGQPLIFNEALPCHPVDIWLEKMQNEHSLYPFAQGKATVRSAHNFEFISTDMIMLVNPLLKKFMVLGVWPNGFACVLTSGSEFQTLVNP